MPVLFYLLFVCLGTSGFSAKQLQRTRYDGYQVLKIKSDLSSKDELERLLDNYKLDIWNYPINTDNPSYQVLVSPEQIRDLLGDLSDIRVNATTHISDVQKLIDIQMRSSNMKGKSKRHSRRRQRFEYNRYHHLHKITRWMESLAYQYRDIVSLIQIGISYEGRRILALKISERSNHTKRIIWQDGLIHAREWVTGGTLLWVTNELVTQYTNGQSEAIQFLREFDWYIVPVWNVDGYKYTWNTDRLWRKSRSYGRSPNCCGVDLNRNFMTPNRGGGTASDDPCSEVYHGSSAFSELETLSIRQFMMSKRETIVGVFTLHSYAQYWLHPYGYTTRPSPDADILRKLSAEAVAAVKRTHGKTYRHGSVSTVAYPVSGGSIDWSYRTLCTKYTFGVELRDSGKHGFLLPPSLIIPTAEEYYEGLKVIVRHIMNEPIEHQTSSFCGGNVKRMPTDSK